MDPGERISDKDGTPLLMAIAQDRSEETICTTEGSTAVPTLRPVMMKVMLRMTGSCGGGGEALAVRVAEGESPGGREPETSSDWLELAVNVALRVFVGVRLGVAP